MTDLMQPNSAEDPTPVENHEAQTKSARSGLSFTVVAMFLSILVWTLPQFESQLSGHAGLVSGWTAYQIFPLNFATPTLMVMILVAAWRGSIALALPLVTLYCACLVWLLKFDLAVVRDAVVWLPFLLVFALFGIFNALFFTKLLTARQTSASRRTMLLSAAYAFLISNILVGLLVGISILSPQESLLEWAIAYIDDLGAAHHESKSRSVVRQSGDSKAKVIAPAINSLSAPSTEDVQANERRAFFGREEGSFYYGTCTNHGFMTRLEDLGSQNVEQQRVLSLQPYEEREKTAAKREEVRSHMLEVIFDPTSDAPLRSRINYLWGYIAGTEAYGIGTTYDAQWFEMPPSSMPLGRLNEALRRFAKQPAGAIPEIKHDPGEKRLLKAYGLTTCKSDIPEGAWLILPLAGFNPARTQALAQNKEEKAHFYLEARSPERVALLFEYAKSIDVTADIQLELSSSVSNVALPTTDFSSGAKNISLAVRTNLPAIVVTKDRLLKAHLIAARSGDLCDTSVGYELVSDEPLTGVVMGVLLVPEDFPMNQIAAQPAVETSVDDGVFRAFRNERRVDMDADGEVDFTFKVGTFGFVEKDGQKSTWTSAIPYRASVQLYSGHDDQAIELISSTYCGAR